MKKLSIWKFFIFIFVVGIISFIHSIPFSSSIYKTLTSRIFDIFGHSFITSLLFEFLFIPLLFVFIPLTLTTFFLIKKKKLLFAFLLPITTFLTGLLLNIIFLGKDVYSEGIVVLAIYIYYVGLGIIATYVGTLIIYFIQKIKIKK